VKTRLSKNDAPAAELRYDVSSGPRVIWKDLSVVPLAGVICTATSRDAEPGV